MKSTDWKDLAELIGIVAIVASLVAVVLELRQTQAALTASTFQERAFDAIDELLEIADSEFLLPVLARTDRGMNREAVEALNEEDFQRLRHFLHARMIDWDNEYYQYQQGYLDADFFEVTTTKSIRQWAPAWRAVGVTEGRDDFRRYVDSVLADADGM